MFRPQLRRLHRAHACPRGRTSIVYMLITAGADASATNRFTARAIATRTHGGDHAITKMTASAERICSESSNSKSKRTAARCLSSSHSRAGAAHLIPPRTRGPRFPTRAAAARRMRDGSRTERSGGESRGGREREPQLQRRGSRTQHVVAERRGLPAVPRVSAKDRERAPPLRTPLRLLGLRQPHRRQIYLPRVPRNYSSRQWHPCSCDSARPEIRTLRDGYHAPTRS